MGPGEEYLFTRQRKEEKKKASFLLPLSYHRALFAAAAKSLQLCPTLWDPIDASPPGSAVPGILQARTLEWVAIASSLLPRQEYWSGVPLPSPISIHKPA